MADGYARAVVDGKVPENEYIILSCKRYLAMREHAEWGDRDYWWSDAHVIEACSFVEATPLGAGGEDPEDTLVLEPWQCWIVAGIFGFRITLGKKHVRFTNDVFIDVGRKNGKSALAARIDAYLFLFEGEPVSEVFIGASTEKQADKAYDPIMRILKSEPELVNEFDLTLTLKGIRKPDGGFIKKITANAKKEDGHNPHVTHIDELHATPHALLQVMTSGDGGRDRQIIIKTTTAGLFASGPAYDERKRAERVLRGIEKADRYFPVIYTVPPELLREPLTWHNVILANPMADALPSLGSKLREALEASRFDPKKKAEFITKRLNVYSNGETRALTEDQWRECEDKTLKVEDFIGKKCWLGADLSSHDDMTALVLMFEDGDDVVVFAWHFIPEGSPRLIDEEMAPTLRDWADGGWITITPGSIVDLDLVQEKAEAICKEHNVEYAVFDQAQSVQMAAGLQKKGIKAGLIRSTPAEVSEPTQDLVIRARNKRMRHNGNPVLLWNAINTCLRPGDLWKPIKDSTQPNLKIDGISAAVHANTARLGRVSVKLKEEKPPFDPYKIVRSFD